MTPESYRCYRLDGEGRLDNDWFDAETDEEAAAQVKAKHPDSRWEIWRERRLVAKLSPQDFDPDDPDLQNAVGERLSALAHRIRSAREPRA